MCDFQQLKRLILVYYCKLIIPSFLLLSWEKKTNLMDAPNFFLGAIAVAVGLPQPSSSMEGLESGEDDLRSLHHWQLVVKHRGHPCKPLFPWAFGLQPSPYLTSSLRAVQFGSTMWRRGSFCFTGKLSPILHLDYLFAVIVSVCSLKHQLMWIPALCHLTQQSLVFCSKFLSYAFWR